MKVAVSSSGPGLDAAVDSRFGRCAYFVIVDTETGEHTDMPNDAASAPGGAGIGAATAVAKAGASAVLTGHVGPNAIRTLGELGINVYQAPMGTVRDALAALAAGQCAELSAPTVSIRAGMGMRRGGRFGGGRGRGGR